MIWFTVAFAQDPVGAPEITVEPGATDVEVTRTRTARPVGTPFVTIGDRTLADGVGSAVAVAETLVLGPDGGVAATTASVRYAAEEWAFGVHLPFATYRTSVGRSTGAGNLRVEGFRRWASGGSVTLAGARIHLPTSNAWTYTFDAISLWPGAGLTGVFQHRRPIGPADLVVHGALGLHGTRNVAPFPGFYVHAEAAVALDTDLPVAGLGATTELSLAIWDPSPVDLGGWLRFTPTDGVRLRGGVLLPVGAWAGASPGRKPAGARELGLQADLALAF